ncbi:hypothetical protein BU14_1992s0003 [Porphyra umbilicalis]|uniref:Uncharacterized protein n=1 Tax=Porphyra umbilicalis TaxID=2786 RepID=A0A1X6NKV8_PORUM|nr:hypothetical protein BU14_1992s0003 [Porphyra umbilicalis]|eukprot:OSX68993.1 hypothetical protein BU14_1992s0003 [Porphyra umbilicalis]
MAPLGGKQRRARRRAVDTHGGRRGLRGSGQSGTPAAVCSLLQ